MGTDLKDKANSQADGDKYNPGERHAHEVFDLPPLNTVDEGIASKEGAADQARSRLRDAESPDEGAGVAGGAGGLKQAEKPKSAPTAPSLATGVGGAAGGIAGLAGKAFAFISGHKKSGGLTAIIVIIIILFALNMASPLAILVAIKEVLSRFPLREAEIGFSKRIMKHTKSRYLGAPACKGNAIKCRHQKGLKPADIKRFNKAGLQLEEPFKIGNKQFYGKITYIDTDGHKVEIDKDNFETVMRQNPVARAKMAKLMTPRSFVFRSAESVKKWIKFGVNRRNGGVGDDDKMSAKDRIKAMREHIYNRLSIGGEQRRPPPENETDEDGNARPEAERANRAFDEFNEEADEANERARNGQWNDTDRANPRGLSETDPGRLSQLGSGARKVAKGTVKSLFTGMLTSIDTYCTVYQVVRMVSLTAKVLVAAQLIRYAFTFLTVNDKMMAGDGGIGGAAAFLAGLLLRPSQEVETAGETFSDAPAWIAITQGAVVDRESLTQFATGGSIMIFFNRAKRMMEQAGASAQTCKHVKSWYGQAGIIIGGIVGTILTWGGGAAAGVAVGAGINILSMILMSYAIPFLIQAYASTISPDPESKGGGREAGNALGSGAAAASSSGAVANGGTFMTKSQRISILRSTFQEQKVMAEAEAINNRERGIFSPDNPNSFQNKFALALAPYIGALNSGNNLASAVLSGNKLIQGAVATVPNMFSQSAGALEGVDPNSINFYRGDACPDEYDAAANLVTTATCARVPAAPQSFYKDTSVAEEEAAANNPNVENTSFSGIRNWLKNRNYLNADWEPNDSDEGDELKKYKEICKENSDSEAVSPDGLNIEGLDNGSKMCFSQDPKYITYFSGYLGDESLNESMDAADEGKFGQESSSIAPEDAGGSLLEGNSQELAKQIIANKKITGDGRYMGQIKDIADGKAGCHVNPTILAYIATMGKTNSFYISSLNRFCTKVLTASGTASYHYRDKGGHAVDFSIINGANQGATGSNGPKERKFVEDSLKVLPKGSGFGQSNCRKPAIAMPSGFRQFSDSCNHLHVQVPVK